MLMKTRVQIYLDEEQDRKLECLAKLLRTSKSRLIRESIRTFLEEHIPPEADPALGLVALAPERPGRSQSKDLSEKHDEHLVRLLRQEASSPSHVGKTDGPNKDEE
jgi:metal-responsive CopG/Arc/MetJ family transcriptional regulator